MDDDEIAGGKTHERASLISELDFNMVCTLNKESIKITW